MPIFLECIWYFREAVQFCNASFYTVMPKYGSPLGRTDFEQKAAFAIEGVQEYVESVANDDRIKIKTRKTVFCLFSSNVYGILERQFNFAMPLFIRLCQNTEARLGSVIPIAVTQIVDIFNYLTKGAEVIMESRHFPAGIQV